MQTDPPQFSPDGRWMAYNSNESERHEVYIRPFEGQGQRTRVSSMGGGRPRWRSDGRELFYLAPDGRMMAVDVRLGAVAEVGAPRALFETGIVGSAILDQYVVTSDGQRFLVAVPESQLPTPLTVMLNWTAGLKSEKECLRGSSCSSFSAGTRCPAACPR